MKYKNKVAFGVIIILLLTGVFTPNNSSKYNDSYLSKIHPIVVQEIKNNPKKLISVIVGKKQEINGIEEAAEKLGAKINSKWDFINAFSVDIEAGKLQELASVPGVLAITNNNKVNETGKTQSYFNPYIIENAYNTAVKSDLVWNYGIYGQGVTIAVLDSGINDNGDLNSRVIHEVEVNSNTNYTVDKYGHGTHVAGIIAGDGMNSHGRYVGIAPKANIINVKYSDDNGAASEIDLLNGLQWIYYYHNVCNIRVVNISSTVATKQSYKESPICAAVEQLWNAGIVVVVSAGNRGGEADSTSYAPANDPYVITVGAVDDMGTTRSTDDIMKSWSSSGVTLDGVMKPDVVAPGANIVSFMSKGTLKDMYPQNTVGNSYFKMSGTSMSAPVVTGIVALMLEKHPEWTPDQVKWVLQNTARQYNNQQEGTPGIVDAELATFYEREFGTTPGYANQGLTPSSFLDPNSGTISYNNMAWSNMAWSNMAWSNCIEE